MEENETAVWERVTEAARSADGERKSYGPVAPDLLDAIEHKRLLVLDYRQLIQRADTRGRRVLTQVAGEERRQERTLSALYFFLTGQNPCLRKLKREKRQELYADGLRRMMQASELGVGRYTALASRTAGEVQQTFLTLAEEERRHFQRLLGLLSP